MKKSILLTLALLLTCTTVQAVDWQPLNIESQDVQLYVDTDSIKTNKKTREYLYAVKYIKDSSEKVVYIKSNTAKHLIGIIRIEDYDENTYNSSRNLLNPHVFMKHLDDNMLFARLNEEVVGIANEVHIVELEIEPTDEFVKKDFIQNDVALSNIEYDSFTNEIPINYKRENVVLRDSDNDILASDNTRDVIYSYLVKTCKMIDQNWTPPKGELNSRAIVYATIGQKGDLVSYRFLQSSGDFETDKSIVDAMQKAQPYLKLPTDNEKIGTMDFKFVFRINKDYKKVIY